MKRSRLALLVVAVVLVGMQAIRPSRDNPPVTGDLDAPADVKLVLRRSCYDCHSNETRWPWYTNIAPVSWLVANHVKEGRAELNFSQWSSYEPKKREHKLEEIEDEVREGEMPIGNYVWIHGDAKLSEADSKLVQEWAQTR